MIGRPVHNFIDYIIQNSKVAYQVFFQEGSLGAMNLTSEPGVSDHIRYLNSIIFFSMGTKEELVKLKEKEWMKEKEELMQNNASETEQFIEENRYTLKTINNDNNNQLINNTSFSSNTRSLRMNNIYVAFLIELYSFAENLSCTLQNILLAQRPCSSLVDQW